MRRTAILVVAAGACGIALACGGDTTGSGDWAGSITDSAGVTLVQNEGVPLWGEGEGWTVSEELRIGEASGDPDYQFGQIGGMDILSDGRILVLDQQGQEIKVYAEDGGFAGSIGEAGSGPGQLSQGGAGVFAGRGDTILVPDMGNTKVQRFASDGSELGSFRIEFGDGIPIRWDMNDEGDLANQLRPLALPNQPAPADSMDRIVRRAYDGTMRDTLMTMPSGRTFSFASGSPEFHFFSAEPAWALADDGGLWFAVNDAYRISHYDPDGTLTRQVRMTVQPKPVQAEDEQVFRDALEEAWEQAGVPPQQLQALKQGVSFEDRFPAFLQFVPGPRGSLWVQRLVPPSELTEEQREALDVRFGLASDEWDVFDAEGRYLGVVEMPERFQPVRFEEERIYGIWRDEFDVQYVMVLSIVGLPGEMT